MARIKRLANHSPNLTEAEWTIMKVVWAHAPCAAGTVQEALKSTKNWAYSTVKTTMDRMAGKGLLKITKIRNLQLFAPCISSRTAQRGEFRRMLERAFDGALFPMMQFLIENEGLSEAELRQLRQLAENTQTTTNHTKQV